MAEEAQPGTVIGGRYTLTRLLGGGGFGQVWQAHDPVLGVDVAVKQVRLDRALPDEARAELMARAAGEARNAARLRDDPHIVTVYDVVEVDEGPWRVPWIVMQWVDGRSLAEELQRDGPLNLEPAVRIAEALLGALEAAHRADVVHRDVKPANVLLAANGSVLLADFGIAVARSDPRLTRASVVIGSPAYMAPERWQKPDGDGRSDLFSLGVTLYEALEGVLPFSPVPPVPPVPPENPVAALTQDPRPMKRAGALAPLILALLEKDPARRPTADAARNMLPPKHRSTDEDTRTLEEIPPRESVTITSKRREITEGYSQAAGKIGGYAGYGIGALMGAVNPSDPVVSLGSLQIGVDNRWGNAALGGAVVGGVLYAVFWLMGWIAGAHAKSDVITLDAHGLTVSTWRGTPERRVAEDGTLEPPGPKTFTLRWDVLERIAVERPNTSSPPAIAVWFRSADKPSKAWRSKHGAEKREGGGVWVYRDDATSPRTVNPERLRDALKRYANGIYEDPHDIPDP
ncbi:serine/threonine-protein kinase [Streptomyces sp. NBC_01190]|uniref:serine/threonine-protein kinase n=1 Tax=Streptomyces sp. NBC_01190 TaxID=2903767 RepID=UPI00386F8331|nr:serine/threonine protein kinase [Streptomyces sp. NBC_01190]